MTGVSLAASGESVTDRPDVGCESATGDWPLSRSRIERGELTRIPIGGLDWLGGFIRSSNCVGRG